MPSTLTANDQLARLALLAGQPVAQYAYALEVPATARRWRLYGRRAVLAAESELSKFVRIYAQS